jgi:hypothetical protein
MSCDAALLLLLSLSLSLSPICANYLFNAYDVFGLSLHVPTWIPVLKVNKMSTALL